jgi:hypothetical protein
MISLSSKNLSRKDPRAALRRAGEPYALEPTQLMRTMMLSSGGMTKRLDRLNPTQQRTLDQLQSSLFRTVWTKWHTIGQPG